MELDLLYKVRYERCEYALLLFREDGEKLPMNRIKLISLAMLLAVPGLYAAETWRNVALIDNNCAAKVKADPDMHSKDCALKCAESGFAVVTSDGTVLRLDAKGNEEAVAALKASSKTDHLRVTVSGDRDGDTIKVKSLKM